MPFHNRISGRKIDGEWYIRVELDGKHHRFDGGSLIACLRALERFLMDQEMGVDDFSPDLHDITGDTKHIGVPLNKEKDNG